MHKSSMLSLSLQLALVAAVPFAAYGQDYNVYLVASNQTSVSISTGQTNTFCAQFQSPNSTNTVLLDLELYNSSNQKVAQNFWDNVTIPQGGTTNLGSYCLTSPSNLSTGTYRWAVGIFRPGWSQLINWYGQVQTFMVSSGGSPGNVVLSSSLLNQSNGIYTLSATFTNTGGTRTVLLDVELDNSSSQRVAQNFVDNVTIGPNGQYTLTLSSPANLASGTYTFVAGVFNPGWNGLLNWYNNVQQFTVSGPPPSGGVTLSFGTIIPGNNIRAGTAVTFQAGFTTPQPPSRQVLIDLEVYNNSNGQKAAQQFFDNQTITNNPQVYSLTLGGGLPAGSYTLKVGVFTPGWGSLLTWYDQVQVLTVTQ